MSLQSWGLSLPVVKAVETLCREIEDRVIPGKGEREKEKESQIAD